MRGKKKEIAVVTLFLIILLVGCGKAESFEAQTSEIIEENGQPTPEKSVAEATPTNTPTPKPTKEPVPTNMPTTQPTEEQELSSTETPAQQSTAPVDYSNISVDIGSYITFGHYEQDSVEADGTEPVEWLVLDTAGNYVLLLSRYVLDVQTYGNSDFVTVNEWLNSDLYNTIFTEEEKKYAVSYTDAGKDTTWLSYPWAEYPEKIHVSGVSGIAWGSFTLPNTYNPENDYLFLPGYDLMERYFERYYDPTYSDPVAVLTDVNASYTLYAQMKAREVNKSDYTEGWWMGTVGNGYYLRQRRGGGHMETYQEYVDMYALICIQHGLWQYGRCLPYAVGTYSGIRPAMWVDLAVFATDLAADAAESSEVSGSTGTVFDIMDMSPEGYAIFGKYEQDNNLDNGSEPLQWIVLAEEDGKLLMSTLYGIDVIAAKDTNECWGTSELREWLNGNFYNSVFSDTEKKYISLTTVTVEPVPFHQHTVDTTEDYVLLLTYNQSIQLDPDHSGAKLEPTSYAIAQGADVKTSGNGEYAKLYCKYWQTLNDIDTHYVGRVIRPAIWVNIESK